MTTEKNSEREHGKDHVTASRDNSTVQTAAMGQIPRSTERILVVIKMCL